MVRVTAVLALCVLAVASSAAAGLYPVGAGKKLFMARSGGAAPTVVFISGLGVYSGTWLSVQKQLHDVTSCRYDRFGLGTSDRPTGHPDARAMVASLHSLLA